MSLDQPVLAGVALPRPSTHSRLPVEVATTTQLADGSDAKYSQGHRMVWSLRWDLATEDTATTVERLGMLVGPVEYVDLDGTVWVVTIADRDPREAIRGTDPVRYTVGLGLQEDAPRQVPPPEPSPTPTAPPATGGDRPVAMVDPSNPRVLLVYAGTPDPADPSVLVWTV